MPTLNATIPCLVSGRVSRSPPVLAPILAAAHSCRWGRRRLRQDVAIVVAGHVGGRHPRENVLQGSSAHRRWPVSLTSRGSVAVTVSVQHIISATSNEGVARPDWEWGLVQELRAMLEQHGRGVG